MEKNKHTMTPCEALGVKDITENERADMFIVAQKSLMDPDYCKSDAIISIIGILGEEDTPSTRRCMACIYTFVESLCEMENQMKKFVDQMSGGEEKK